ncbi:hypothetical protein K443DRAFT_675762 [Laccaria amethystina LaAM-08-1]|uniref:Uncharacterized protein n=1 Tax=Laccaria amethystina LaAM-08-1 TaxID=1095629 RepID=A0A0C9Y9N2_9AGAR|nr:hypothetical protein K443DRAFT_675762 [Laccaria amethystina LaAM-08-1]
MCTFPIHPFINLCPFQGCLELAIFAVANVYVFKAVAEAKDDAATHLPPTKLLIVLFVHYLSCQGSLPPFDASDHMWATHPADPPSLCNTHELSQDSSTLLFSGTTHLGPVTFMGE